MDVAVEARSVAQADLPALVPLLGELNDLKRVRVAGGDPSLAVTAFRRAWGALCAGDDVGAVARARTAAALAATRLPGLDPPVLASLGLSDDDATELLHRALTEALATTGPWQEPTLSTFGDAALPPGRAAPNAPPAACNAAPTKSAQGETAPLWEWSGDESPGPSLPPFVDLLADQPRAGATCPGKPRLVLEPPENHAEHCVMVAVYAVLLAPLYGADPAVAFLAGLAHHLHNARLPDSGFTGEELLGTHLAPLMARLTDEALDQLPGELRATTAAALAVLPDADSPEGRTFHAADVLDRVLQQRHHAVAASFTLDQALGDLQLVHAGPVQAFHLDVLADAALWP